MVQKSGLTPEEMVRAPELVKDGISLEEFKLALSLTDKSAQYWFDYFSKDEPADKPAVKPAVDKSVADKPKIKKED